jgi:hypothetical protein
MLNLRFRSLVTALARAAEGRKVAGEPPVLNLNQLMVVTALTDEDKKQAYKTGRIAEMSLKQAGLEA